MNIQIGELAKRTAYPIQTIRYYEREGLSSPSDRSSGNSRLYNGWHIERLQFILHCRSLGMSLSDVRTLLHHRERSDRGCGVVNILLDKHIEEIEQRIEALGVLKHHLCVLCETYSDGRAAEAYGIPQGLFEGDGTCTGDGTHH